MSSIGILERIAAWPWIEGATILCGFAWGAMFGSFINVVAHRLPRGASLVTSPSRCPRCGAAIRPQDNVPVLGWLLLRGRCRDCGGEIPATYPLVEAGCGTLIAFLAATELVAAGAWPGRRQAGIDRLLQGDLAVLASFGLHAAVVLMIVAWSRLDAANWRLSRVWLAASLAAAAAALAAVPRAGPRLVWQGVPEGDTTADGLAAAALGMVAGALAARATAVMLGPAGRGQALTWGLPLVGSVLGWQAVTISAALAAVGSRLGRLGPGGTGLVLALLATVGLSLRHRF
jgi:leader peptidase (prepilin peptidase)/N-methyltransferase